MKRMSADEFIREFGEPYKKGSELRKFLPDDTIMEREFKKLINKTCLKKYLNYIGLNVSSETYCHIYKYIESRINISNVMIYQFREKIRPAEWYTLAEGESLPPEVKFTPSSVISDFLSRYSIGHLKLREIIAEHTISGTAKMYDISRTKIEGILYRRRHQTTGEMIFRALPSFEIITKLKGAINPDLWYVLPEESGGEGIKEEKSVTARDVEKEIQNKYGFLLKEAEEIFGKSEAARILPQIVKFSPRVTASQVMGVWEFEKITGSPYNSPFLAKIGMVRQE